MNDLSSLFCFKDVIPKELQSHTVNKCLCSNCNVTYYGKIEHHLNIRSSEHLGYHIQQEKRVECKPSAVSDHLLLHTHIALRRDGGVRLSLKEFILISRDSSLLNKNTVSHCHTYCLIKIRYYQWGLVNFFRDHILIH